MSFDVPVVFSAFYGPPRPCLALAGRGTNTPEVTYRENKIFQSHLTLSHFVWCAYLTFTSHETMEPPLGLISEKSRLTNKSKKKKKKIDWVPCKGSTYILYAGEVSYFLTCCLCEAPQLTGIKMHLLFPDCLVILNVIKYLGKQMKLPKLNIENNYRLYRNLYTSAK